MPVPDHDLLSAYLATTWRVRLASGTLLVRISEPTPLTNVGVITAYNPGSQLRDRVANRIANRHLLDELRRRGGEVCPAVALGHGPNPGPWREPGFAVTGLALGVLVSLAGTFGQNAIVWVPCSGAPRLVITRAGFLGRRVGTTI